MFASASVLAASLTARAAGAITFTVVALLLGVGLLVGGVRLLRRPGGGGRKAGAIVMIVLGALLLRGHTRPRRGRGQLGRLSRTRPAPPP